MAPTRERHAHVEPLDARAYEVVAKKNIAGAPPQLGASQGFPDAAEQPKRRVMAILSERENELSVEVAANFAPRVPAQPSIGVIVEGVDQMRLTVEDWEV